MTGHDARGPAQAPRQAGGPPPARLLQVELRRASTELAAFMALSPLLQAAPRGEPHPVLVLPGFMAGDESTIALRGYLRTLGYPVQGWRLGRNVGPSREILTGLDRCLTELADRHGRRVSVVGWSLGGIFGRELAHRHPGSVRQVITLGSPFRLADPSQSRASQLFDRYSHLHVDPSEFPRGERARRPLPVPTTAIYSRSDGVVAWQTCLDSPGHRENVEVRSSHCGMGHHPAAVYVVADRLAQRDGRWAPFRPPVFLRRFYPGPASVARAA
jgi:pimeloyl-ACP methyl ester carboxylesterase